MFAFFMSLYLVTKNKRVVILLIIVSFNKFPISIIYIHLAVIRTDMEEFLGNFKTNA